MRRSALATGALLGATTSLPLMALLYLGHQVAGFPFLPFDIFDSLARVLPGGLVTSFIDLNVRIIRALALGETSDVAKLIQQLLALALMVASGAMSGVAVAFVLRQRTWSGGWAGSAVGFAVFLLALIVEMGRGLLQSPSLAVLWLGLVFVIWGSLLGTWLDSRAPQGATQAAVQRWRAGRRRFLSMVVASSVTIALTAWGLGRLLEEQEQSTGANLPLTQPPPVPESATRSAGTDGVVPASGTRPAVSANQDFYRIDINLRSPAINASSWQLEVAGLFDRPRNLALPDLMAYESVHVPITLCCISNPVGGDLIGSAYWTGVRLRDLLTDLGIQPSARQLVVEAADGFYESVTMTDLSDPRTLLVYGMNGVSLPVEHGFPLRVLIPNRYGMKQPKWITRIEAIDRDAAGYWVERGWSQEARPHVLSIIDTAAKNNTVDGKVPIGGIAWAGDRGIALVEIQVDNDPWQAAMLIPPLGPLTWVQWRYDWPLATGRHTFRVRATDGTGNLQTKQLSDPHPNGATGYHEVTAAF